MDEFKASDLATKLLNSKDSRVAAAAKRIFSKTPIDDTEKTESESSWFTTGGTSSPNLSLPMTTHPSFSSTSSLSLNTHAIITSDIREAASAVAMLDSKRSGTPSPNTFVSKSSSHSDRKETKANVQTPEQQSEPQQQPQLSKSIGKINNVMLVERKKQTSEEERLHRR